MVVGLTLGQVSQSIQFNRHQQMNSAVVIEVRQWTSDEMNVRKVALVVRFGLDCSRRIVILRW
jgi:hypothetical protein